MADGFITAGGGQRGMRLLQSRSYWSDLKMVCGMTEYLNYKQVGCSEFLWHWSLKSSFYSDLRINQCAFFKQIKMSDLAGLTLFYWCCYFVPINC